MAESRTYRSTIQSEKILGLLRAAHGAWVPLPEILALGIAQYNARIFDLRRQGFTIENRTEVVGNERHSWFRLVSPSPEPANSQASEPPKKAIPWSERKPVTGLELWDAERQ